MPSLNKVFLIGNLTKDPEVRYTPSGKAVGDLRMAVNRRYTTPDGQTRDETCFVSVVVWGRTAEICGERLTRGMPVFVEGRLQYEEWEKDGQKFNRMRVVSERVQFLTPGRGEGGEAKEGQRPRAEGARREAPQQQGSDGGDAPPQGAAESRDEEDLPF